MDEDGFWELIERSRAATGDPWARLRWLQRQLAERPESEIVEFQVWIDHLRRRADTWHMWNAAYLICDGLCSGDGFWYFQVWLIGLGRQAFEQALADPDNLASRPEVLRLAGRPVDDWSNDEWPGWESLGYVAFYAYEQRTGDGDGDGDGEAFDDAMQARGHHSPSDPAPTGEDWDVEDPAEAARRLPQLSRLFPLTDRAIRDRRGRAAIERMLAEHDPRWRESSDRLLAERGQTTDELIAQFMREGPPFGGPPDAGSL